MYTLSGSSTWCVFMEALQGEVCPLHFLFFHRLRGSTIVLLGLRQFILNREGKMPSTKGSKGSQVTWTHVDSTMAENYGVVTNKAVRMYAKIRLGAQSSLSSLSNQVGSFYLLQIAHFVLKYTNNMSCTENVRFSFVLTFFTLQIAVSIYQRDGDVFIWKLVFPPGVICEV